MQSPLPLLLVGAAVALLGVMAGRLIWQRLQRRRRRRLPDDWSLAPRPVFSADERRVYRELREALPQHVVLSKLPLVRFCQPNDPQQRRYWYELLGALHVSFAICSGSGRVLAAIDLKPRAPGSRRGQRIKEAVLAACQVRYLRCDADSLPSIPELELLVRGAGDTMPPATRPTWRASGDSAGGWDSSLGESDSFFNGRVTRSAPAGDDGESPTGTHGP